MTEDRQAFPEVVSADEWRRCVEELRIKEKALTRLGDEVSAQRRRLPMVRVDADYVLRGPEGEVTLVDLFGEHLQLIVYHFMFGPEADEGCGGCSWVVDAMSHPAHLRARDVAIAAVSRAPLEKLLRYRERMGWDLRWYSSYGSAFNHDMGVTVDDEEDHGVSVFLRRDDAVYRTYFTGDRGVEHLGSHWTYLDLTPYGRQESWEDSPPGWPQAEPYQWQRRHDDYD